MEANETNTNQGRGAQSPSQSPPLPGTSSQQAGATGSEESSTPGGKSSSAEAEGSNNELAVEVKKAAKAKVKEGADTAKRTVSSTASHGAEALGRAADTLRDQERKPWLRQPPLLLQGCLNMPNALKNVLPRICFRTWCAWPARILLSLCWAVSVLESL